MERAQRAVLQALDLQRMRGHGRTLPVLVTETCGLALASTDLVREQTGLNAHGERMVLLLSTQDQAIQLLQHAYSRTTGISLKRVVAARLNWSRRMAHPGSSPQAAQCTEPRP